VPFIALLRESDLPLAFPEAFFLQFGGFVVAAGAAHAFYVQGREFVFGADRVAAGAAQVVMTGLEVVVYRHALVKNKAFAAPAAFGLRHGFKVLEDAAFKVVNLVKALGAHEGG
jgi:hypothetical protein